ncbi:tetrapyrrole biosynthesis, uroporphyrinogen III synthase [Hesseltinella vesiculosa]|uniref:Tetrapyrrole biosynthesis, uroporphyrinogen III synthase n=1 Tax=Hesseltinella vesiculosa TaxID=101127 RepID=A0A1X2GWL4_9FUNG|nr:tetrapyrrole biosynthesis, uroporphyrinogen III synthase [Hesseltinella vesiculosa]
MVMQVCFFKHQSDEYQNQSLDHNYDPLFIPVLDQQYTHEHLTQVFRQGPQAGFQGILLTSQRSVTTLVTAWQQLDPAQKQPWRQTFLGIVGDKTATMLRDSWTEWQGTLVTADTATALANTLLHNSTATGYFLFLAGDKRRDVLPERLRQAGYELQEVQTYATVSHPDLAQQLLLHRPSLANPQHWVVFFSPSGVNYIQPHLPFDLHQVKIASIGPTTTAHLNQLGYPVHATANRPDAQHLLQAIHSHDQFSSL